MQERNRTPRTSHRLRVGIRGGFSIEVVRGHTPARVRGALRCHDITRVPRDVESDCERVLSFTFLDAER